jgi:hypothetical protein
MISEARYSDSSEIAGYHARHARPTLTPRPRPRPTLTRLVGRQSSDGSGRLTRTSHSALAFIDGEAARDDGSDDDDYSGLCDSEVGGGGGGNQGRILLLQDYDY